MLQNRNVYCGKNHQLKATHTSNSQTESLLTFCVLIGIYIVYVLIDFYIDSLRHTFNYLSIFPKHGPQDTSFMIKQVLENDPQ